MILYILLIKVVIENLEINNIDIEIVFLNNELTNTEILMEISRYFEEIFSKIKLKDNLYLKLKKSFYKLKQISKV